MRTLVLPPHWLEMHRLKPLSVARKLAASAKQMEIRVMRKERVGGEIGGGAKFCSKDVTAVRKAIAAVPETWELVDQTPHDGWEGLAIRRQYVQKRRRSKTTYREWLCCRYWAPVCVITKGMKAKDIVELLESHGL